MQIACAIEADGVVFHVGSHLGSGFEQGLERVLPAMEQILELCSERTWLLMENSAGAGGTIGRSIEELATLYERLDRHPRLGICLDSCHLFASGCDVTDPKAVNALLREVDEAIGLDRLRALHVNDSLAPLASNRDRHANIGEGLMGEGLGAFLAHRKVQRLPAVLEVPGPDDRGPNADELRKTRELHAPLDANDEGETDVVRTNAHARRGRAGPAPRLRRLWRRDRDRRGAPFAPAALEELQRAVTLAGMRRHLAGAPADRRRERR